MTFLYILTGVLILCVIGAWSPPLGFILLVISWYAIRWVQNNPNHALLLYGRLRVALWKIKDHLWPSA